MMGMPVFKLNFCVYWGNLVVMLYFYNE